MRLNSPVSGLSLLLLCSFALLPACKQKAEIKLGVTKVLEIAPNGCVAALWATRTTEETIQKRAAMHIDGNIEPSQINTELMQAVVSNQLDKVDSLLSAGVDLEETNESGCTALIWASALDRQSIALKLIDAGANVSKSDATGKTPLMMASKAGNEEVVRELATNGANVNAAQTGGINEIGDTALHHAVRRADNEASILFLIEKGAEVDAKNEHNQTPLINAAEAGNLEIVKRLVESGANTSLRTDRGETALARAKSRNRAEVVMYLEKLK